MTMKAIGAIDSVAHTCDSTFDEVAFRLDQALAKSGQESGGIVERVRKIEAAQGEKQTTIDTLRTTQRESAKEWDKFSKTISQRVEGLERQVEGFRSQLHAVRAAAEKGLADAAKASGEATTQAEEQAFKALALIHRLGNTDNLGWCDLVGSSVVRTWLMGNEPRSKHVPTDRIG
jgi:chromosome segregation ATPase